MTNFKTWIQAMRAPFFTATLMSVAVGAIFAWYDTNNFMWVRFWITIFGVLCINAGTNLANDYCDHLSGCDAANLTPTPFSGGSRMSQNGILSPKSILYFSLLCFIIGGMVGLYLNYVSRGNVIFLLGIIGVFLGVFYSAKPFQIGYDSFGELAVGIGCGPVIVLGAYYVQAQVLTPGIFFLSIPIGILTALILCINEFPDYDSDKQVGKKTLVVILGKRNAIKLYYVLLIIVYLSIVVMVTSGIVPVICLITLFSLPLALKACSVLWKNYDKVNELLPANAMTIGVHFVFGLLLCTGIVLGKIF